MIAKKGILVSCAAVAMMLALVLAGACAPAPSVTPTATPSPAPTATTAAPTFTFKYANAWSQTHVVGQNIIWYAGEVNKRTGGRVKLEVYHGGTLGSAADLFDLLQKGVCDISNLTFGYAPGATPVCDFLNGPFAWPSAEDASVVFHELAQKGYMDKDTSRYVVVSWLATSPTNVISTRSVRKLEDLKGLKFRTAGGAQTAFLELLGLTVVSVTAPELYMALEKGIIQGAFYNIPGTDSYKLYEIAKHITVVNIGTVGGFTAFNKDAWAKLPPDLQKTILGVGADYATAWGRRYDGLQVEALKKFNDLKIDIYTPPAEELSRWLKTTRPAIDSGAADLEKKGYPANKLLGDLAEISKKHGVPPYY